MRPAWAGPPNADEYTDRIGCGPPLPNTAEAFWPIGPQPGTEEEDSRVFEPEATPG
jgi:hypothetical protein